MVKRVHDEIEPLPETRRAMRTDPYYHVVQLHLRDLERSVDRHRGAARPIRRALRQIKRSVRRSG